MDIIFKNEVKLLAQLKKPTIKNPELRMAVQEWKENRTPMNEEKMFEELKKAKFIAPVIMEDIPDDIDLTQGSKYETKAKFILVKDQKGTHFFPAFTEWLEVLKWNNDPSTQPVVVTFENYCALLLNKKPEARGIVIDPKGMNLMVPTPIFAKAMGINLPELGKNAPQGGTKKVNMDVIDLKEYPQELIDKYKAYLEVTQSIHGAYMLGMVNKEDQNMKSFFLVLDLDPVSDEARKVIFDQLGKISQPYTTAPIGLMPIEAPVGQQIAFSHEPFYSDEVFAERLEELKKKSEEQKQEANRENIQMTGDFNKNDSNKD